MKHAFYAGSFDPITKGHLDIVEQALFVFDQITIGIGRNPRKARMFPEAGAQLLISLSLQARGWQNRVTVKTFDGALVHAAEKSNADAIVRGLRQVSDFNDEFVQHGVNERISKLPIVYFICRHEFLHVSSSTAKEMASFGMDVSWLVDKNVEHALTRHYLEHPRRA